MTGSQSQDKRVVYLDGYAGEGRYENGEPASAEIALRVASHFRARHGITVECFFTEAQQKSFERLNKVVEHYRASRVLAHARRGEVDAVLDSVVQRAARAPLFLFLDPCGLVLPQRRLVDVLARQRPEKKPPTELLMNFSMMAVWRLGGHVRSPNGNERSLQRFDDVCGGTWWRKYFAEAAAPPRKRVPLRTPSRPWQPSTPVCLPSAPACSCSRYRSPTMRTNALSTGWSSPPAVSTACGCSATRSPGPATSGGRRWTRARRARGS
ncbi:three-Cys-motif partner protein TcmP [Streptomyces sp. NPDC005917]|uniref:three-Cys-motif partner protein TcmP n=1 Tax=unclassified Streptomyces TaxID=2593676 RepID=UPI0033C42B17